MMNQFHLTFTLFVILNSVCSAPTTTKPFLQEDTEVQTIPTPTSQEDKVTTKMVELHGRTTAQAILPITAIAPSLPNDPYDCSTMNRSQKASAVASFQKGLSLIVDELNYRVLQVKLVMHIESIAIPR